MSDTAAPAPSASEAPASSSDNSSVEASPERKSTQVDGDEVLSGKKTPPSAKAAVAEAKRMRLVGKVDGAEEIFEGTEAEMLAKLQKARGAEKRMAEAAEIKKRDAARREAAKKNPAEIWKLMQEDYGIEDVDTLAEQRLVEKYKAEMMSDEEKQQAAFQKELETYRAQEAERKEQEAKAKQEQLENKIWQETERTFVQALEKTGLPGSMDLLKEMVKIAQLNLEYGLELTPDQIAAEVREAEEAKSGSYRESLTKLDGDALLSKMGDDVVEKVRLALIARARGQKASGTATPLSRPPQKPKTDNPFEGQKVISRADWRKFMKE